LLHLKSLLIAIVLVCSSSQSALANDVTLMIYLDFSGSLDDNRGKVAQLIPRITNKMKNTCGKFRIATNNILYEDVEFNNYRPYGSPAFLTDAMPNAVDELAARISNPFSGVLPVGTNTDPTYNITSGNKEITYSSISRSVVANLDDLRGEDMVAALIITDAAPGFEYGSPEEELALIKQALGTTRFMAGAISVNLENGMKLADMNPSCSADMSGVLPNRFQGNVLPPNIQEWMDNDLEDLKMFSHASGGWHWDICRDDLEASIDDFLSLVIMESGCQLMM